MNNNKPHEPMTCNDLYEILRNLLMGQVTVAILSATEKTEDQFTIDILKRICSDILDDIKLFNIFSDFFPAYCMGLLSELMIQANGRDCLNGIERPEQIKMKKEIYSMVHGNYAGYLMEEIGQINIKEDHTNIISINFRSGLKDFQLYMQCGPEKTPTTFSQYMTKYHKDYLLKLADEYLDPLKNNSDIGKIKIFKNLGKDVLSKQAIDNKKIQKHFIRDINYNHTAEECIMVSCMFDIALQAKQCCDSNDFYASMYLYSHVTTNLLLTFRIWKDESKVSQVHWENITTMIHGSAYCGEEQLDVINKVLTYYNTLG